MEDNNEDVLKEEAVIEEVRETIEESEDSISATEEILRGDSSLLEEAHKEEGKVIKFIKKILASAIDQIIVIAVSLLLLVVFDFTLRVLGLYIAERQPIFLFIYVLVNIVYGPICDSTKLKKTIGKRVILK